MIDDPEGGDKMIFNENSMEVIDAYAEPAIKDAKAGERFQFFRHGYYIADAKLYSDENRIFNRIVDLKSGWKPAK